MNEMIYELLRVLWCLNSKQGTVLNCVDTGVGEQDTYSTLKIWADSKTTTEKSIAFGNHSNSTSIWTPDGTVVTVYMGPK